MARQTRAQRRARRAEGGATTPDPAAASRARASTQTATRAASSRAPEVGERHVPGKGFAKFVRESWAELKKVEWPRQNQLIQGVVVVLVACIVVGVYLYANDLVWKRFVHDVLLR